MYPITPEMTPEQNEKLIKLLETIGSGGKGCRSDPIWADMGENRPKRFTLTHNGRRIVDGAINVALEVEHDEASHIAGLGNGQ